MPNCPWGEFPVVKTLSANSLLCRVADGAVHVLLRLPLELEMVHFGGMVLNLGQDLLLRRTFDVPVAFGISHVDAAEGFATHAGRSAALLRACPSIDLSA